MKTFLLLHSQFFSLSKPRHLHHTVHVKPVKVSPLPFSTFPHPTSMYHFYTILIHPTLHQSPPCPLLLRLHEILDVQTNLNCNFCYNACNNQETIKARIPFPYPTPSPTTLFTHHPLHPPPSSFPFTSPTIVAQV